MSARIFCNVLVRQLRKASHQLMLRQGQINTEQCLAPSRIQMLHLKVYDNEAGLVAKREANKHKEELRTELAPKPGHVRNVIDKAANDSKDELSWNKDDTDTFGSGQIAHEDEGDLEEEEYIQNPKSRARKLRTVDYARIIKDHLKANQTRDAIMVLEQRMLKDDRVKPENYIYSLLISGCAKAGYTRKAFELFTKMRQRGLIAKGGTYTSLFNACANAPSAADGLERANRLREIMLEKGYEPNVKNYNAMIKAYGRCGDVKTAYLLADEMMEKQLPVNSETFNFLLQACASDVDFGFRHCLLTWHKMLQQGIRPDYYTFNTVLRCVRNCGFGDLQTMQKVLRQILNQSQSLCTGKAEETPVETLDEGTSNVGEAPKTKLIESKASDSALQLTNDAQQLEVPNLLADRPHLGSLVALSEVSHPHERFLLLGGFTSFLELMKLNNVTPDIETFTQMLEVIPPTNSAEKQLITMIRRIGLKSDIDFFNVLIKKRAMRFDYEGAREVLGMVRTAGLHPDIVTYGVLALGCQTEEAAQDLLQQMRENGVRMNIQILGAMLRQGCAQKAFAYVTSIMQLSLDENIKPNHIFLRHLHNFYTQCARDIDARHPSTKTKNFKKSHAKFCDKLRLYQEEHGILNLKLEDAIKKLRERPYAQYKEANSEHLEPVKNEKLAKKLKLRKYIKKIKIDNLRGENDEISQHQNRIEQPQSII